MGQVVPILELGVGHGLFIPLGLEPWGTIMGIYLGLHPPKHGKLHPYKKFHFVNTCHFHIGQ
jgi:hypothetical protein